MHIAQIQILAEIKSDSRLCSDTVIETSCNDTSQQKLCSKYSEQKGGWLLCVACILSSSVFGKSKWVGL